MKLRTGFIIGFGAGYVLGAKAGRERYQQIVDATRAFLDNPGVQRLTDEVNKTVSIGRERVSSAASRRVEQVSGTLAEQASKARSYVSGGQDAEVSDTAKAEPTAEAAKKPGAKKAGGETAGAPPSTTTTTTRSGHSG
ncbi:MAG TPA: hypothetical protein VFA45_07820 [Actinomycetes bacterium]|jgi:hypothetical protein|nr:hypothetical protein [Actinomycetes bacterium]